MQHTFFVHFFAVVLHDYNVKLPETSSLHVLWRKCRASLYSCSIFFFSLPLVFTKVAARISYFITAATKFSCRFSNNNNKKMSPFSFISSSSCLSLFFSLSFAGLSLTFSFSMSLSFSALPISGHDN